MFESEDHARPWFYPKLIVFLNDSRIISPLTKVWGVDLMLEAPRAASTTGALKCSPKWNFILGQQQRAAGNDGGAFADPYLTRA